MTWNKKGCIKWSSQFILAKGQSAIKHARKTIVWRNIFTHVSSLLLKKMFFFLGYRSDYVFGELILNTTWISSDSLAFLIFTGWSFSFNNDSPEWMFTCHVQRHDPESSTLFCQVNFSFLIWWLGAPKVDSFPLKLASIFGLSVNQYYLQYTGWRLSGF